MNVLSKLYLDLYERISKDVGRVGYRIALRNTPSSHLELVAVPWTDTACKSTILVSEVVDIIQEQLSTEFNHNGPIVKPQGRTRYELRMAKGIERPIRVDLDVIPPLPKPCGWIRRRSPPDMIGGHIELETVTVCGEACCPAECYTDWVYCPYCGGVMEE